MTAVGRVISANTDKNDFAVSFANGEVQSGLHYMQQCGFKSVPKPGAACLTASNGDRKNAVIIGTMSPKEPKLDSGDSAIFSDKAIIKASGNQVYVGNGTDSVGALVAEIIDFLKEMAQKVTLATAINGKPLLPEEAPKLTLKLTEIETKWNALNKRA